MAAGFPLVRAQLDAQMGNLVVNARDALDACSAFLTRFEALNGDASAGGGHDQLLEAGYTVDDLTLIDAAFFSLDALNKVGHAGTPPPGPNDFWFEPNKLTALR